MKRIRTVLAAASLALSLPVGAQTLDALKVQAAASETRLKELHGLMEQLDGRIEQSVDKVLKEVTSVSDSQGSGTRIAGLKEDLIKGLGNSLNYYKQRRAATATQLARPVGAPRPEDAMKQEISYLEGRGEERINQIIDLAGTLTRQTDFKKYEDIHHDEGYGYSRTERRVRDEYRQSRRQGSKTSQIQEDIVIQLEAAIARLEQEKGVLRAKIARTTSPGERNRYYAQMGDIDKKLELRKGQRDAVYGDYSASQGGRELSQSEAFQFDQKIRRDVADIRKDFQELVRLKSEYDVELARLKSLKSRINLSGGGGS